MNKDAVLQLRLPQDLKERLAAKAAEQGESVSFAARKAIRSYIKGENEDRDQKLKEIVQEALREDAELWKELSKK